jgi:hypothetical protein
MFQDVHDSGALAGKKLRVLDGLEEYFWLSENTLPRTTVVLAELEGPTTVGAWRGALTHVQQRYPLLCARVRKEPGQRPYFETLSDTPLPLRVVPLEGANLNSLIGEEPLTSFGYANGPLARLTICHSRERCAILFSAHHLATDGRTNLRIVHDLIAAVSGATLGDPLPLLPAIGGLFGLSEPTPYAELCPAKAPSSNFRLSLPVPIVQRHRVYATDLRVTARAEGTTVQGALIAAFFLAGRRYSERWRAAPVMCFSPIDLRPILGISDAAGAVISVLPSVMQPSDDLPFWEFARKLKEGMRALQTRESIALGLNAVREVVRREGDPDDLNTIDAKGFYNHDLMISNYGDPGVRTDFGQLRLKGLYPSVISGGIDTQTISVLTVEGALHITHISRRPCPSLVTDACTILLGACCVSFPAADLMQP